jgi:DNA-binding MarR family transcriptional regulator
MASDPDKIPSPCHCAVLRKASRHLSQAYDVALAPAGLKTTQFSLLAAIYSNGGESFTMGDLAEAMVMDRSTLGHNLRPLERNHLITIETGGSDARRRQIRLTAQGHAKLKRAGLLWKKMQARFEAAYGAKSTARLRQALLKLATIDLATGVGKSKTRSTKQEKERNVRNY